MEVATVNRPDHAVVFHHTRDHPRMDTAAPNQAGAFVFHPPRSRRRHGHHNHIHNHRHRVPYYDNYPPDSDTESALSTRSSCSSTTTDSDADDDSVYYHGHHVSFRPRVHHRAGRRRGSWWWGGWPRGSGVLACPDPSYYASPPPWAAVTTSGLGVLGGAAGLVPAAGAVVPQVHLQQAQPQQQQPRRYGYRRFHYQGGERVRSAGCGGHGHGHHHHRHHHHHHHNNGGTSTRSPRRCILPRFGRWLVGDPPDRARRGRRCEDGCGGGGCCDDGCGAGATTTTTTPTVHHEDEYWGPGHQTTIPNWAAGSQASSPWRYGGPSGSGPGDAVGPGGTIEEVEEGGTAPAPAQPAAAAVLPVPVATPAAAAYDHYHLDDGDRGRRRRSRRDDDGMLGLVERERRRDSERQMADADASHRREAMMMGLMGRAARRRGDRGRDGGLDARDILGVLLDGVAAAERKGRRGGGGHDVEEEGGGGGGCGGRKEDDGLRGALDALSRRVDAMVLSGRGEEAAGAAASGGRRKMKAGVAPRVKFDRAGSGSGSVVNREDGAGAGGGKITFSRRGEDGDQADTDTDETNRPSLAGGGRGVRRGRPLRRAGSASTSED